MAARAAQCSDSLALLELRPGGVEPCRVTYWQLVQQVQRAAAALRISGICGDGVVGIALQASVAMIVHQLATWWLGAAFVPLDTALPAARLRYLVHDSGATVVVAAPSDAEMLAQSAVLPDGTSLMLDSSDTDEADCANAGCIALAAPAVDSAAAVCHIAYTSGSTGTPKGVVCQHRSLHSYCLANAHVHGVLPKSQILLAAAPSFDPSIGEAYTALLAGATLVLAPRAAVTSALETVLRAGSISHICTTPLLWSQLEAEAGKPTGRYPALQVVTLGGEKVPKQLVETWAESVRLVNVYGTTEGTVYQLSNTYEGAKSNPLCVGRPLPGVAVAVVRRSSVQENVPETMTLVERGEIGELLTGGVQTAAGYLGPARATESAAAFLPLSAVTLNGNVVQALRVRADTADEQQSPFWYRTGDLAVWRSDVELEVVGRLDSQVKINGVRVELGEIEENLRHCVALVSACAVYVADDGKAAALVKLQQSVWPGESATLGCRLQYLVERALRLHCEARLPWSLRPAHYAMVKSLPLGPTHKLDRSALPALFASAQQQCAAAEAATCAKATWWGNTETLEQDIDKGLLQLVAEVWRNVLGLPEQLAPLKGDADFGTLGGDSLTALRVVRELHTKVLVATTDGGKPQPLPSLDKGIGDFGVITGVLAPAALLRRSRLGEYVEFLSKSGIIALDHPPDVGRPQLSTHKQTVRLSQSEAEAWNRAAVQLQIVACELGLPGATVVRSLLDAGAPPEPPDRVDAVVNNKVGIPGIQPRKRQGGPRMRRVVLAPLHVAAKFGNVDAMRALLDAGASLTLATAGTRAMAAHFAAAHSAAALRMLLDAGSPLRATDQNKQGLLHVAAREGNADCVKLLLDRFSMDRPAAAAAAVCELRDRWNRTAVEWACVNGHADVLDHLIRAGASVQGIKMSAQKHHKRTHGRLQPPLHLAVLRASAIDTDAGGPEGALDCMSLLLAAGAKVEAVDEMGVTALELTRQTLVGAAAVGKGSEVCRQMLLDARAKTLSESN
eukprot:SAG31_NODE_492_length_14913_cov_4.109086_3_plen_1016_part_00